MKADHHHFQLLQTQQEALRQLGRHRVRAVIFGGQAVLFYGIERRTEDLDLLLDTSSENLKRLRSALNTLGIELTEERIDRLSRPRAKLSLPRCDTELVSSLEGLDSGNVFADAVPMDIRLDGDGTPIGLLVISKDHLIQSKRLALAALDREPEKKEIDCADLDALLSMTCSADQC